MTVCNSGLLGLRPRHWRGGWHQARRATEAFRAALRVQPTISSRRVTLAALRLRRPQQLADAPTGAQLRLPQRVRLHELHRSELAALRGARGPGIMFRGERVLGPLPWPIGCS